MEQTTGITVTNTNVRTGAVHLIQAYRPGRYTGFVSDVDIQIVSNAAGDPTAVIIPIDLWREISSERETAQLLRSEAMKQRLLAAKQRDGGLSLEAAVEKLGI
jgi:hypothetical protein